MKKKAEEAKSKKKKAAPIAKSLIVWEVKPWGEDTNLEALADKIIGIWMDGLYWKTEWKKEPFTYAYNDAGKLKKVSVPYHCLYILDTGHFDPHFVRRFKVDYSQY